MILQKFGRANSILYLQSRGLREYWRQAYLKDLYHRRELLGADDPLPRSAFPNWNFNTELSAFKHRAGVEDLKKDELTRIMTSPTYFDRAEILVEQNGESSREDNSVFIDKGEHRLRWQLSAILRHQWPKAPEEYVQAVVDHILSVENLLTIANQLGIQHLVRTLEFPAPKDDVIAAFWALLGAMNGSRVHGFVNEFVLPYLTEVPFEDVLPFREPLPIAEAYLKKVGSYRKVEPRIIHSHGEFSAMPLYMVGIYGDEQLVAKAPGEYLSIATDLAAQLSLLKIWDIRWNEQSFSFLNEKIPIHQFEKPNHHLTDVVGAETDLSLLSKRELQAEPINVFQMANTYENTVRAEVGLPLRRRLRHKFSRGSLAKRSLRRLIKPKVFTI